MHLFSFKEIAAMKRLLMVAACGLFALLILLDSPSAAFALRVAPQQPAPVGQRVARNDAAIVGTVTAIEEKTVSAPQYPGSKDKVEYYVATVKVDEAISGVKGVTHIKVAFLAPAKPVQPIDPKDRPIRPIRPIQGQLPPTLTKGQEALLFLRQHHAENFYIMAQFDDLIDKKGDDFKTGLEEAKKATKVLDDPKKALKVENKAEKFQAVATMFARYRTAPITLDPNSLKQEEIDAEESKLLLAALAESDWTPKPGFQMGFTSPIMCFQALGLTDKDGWSFKGGNFNDLAQKWLKDNTGKYRVKKYVVAAEKK